MSKILETLQATVEERRKVYGSPKPNMQDIADLWNIVFKDKLASEQKFEPHDIATAMRLVKEARLMKSPDHVDSLLDIAGYVLVGEACVTE